MVSALANTRMIAAQMALQVLMTSPDDSSSQDSSSSTPARRHFKPAVVVAGISDEHSQQHVGKPVHYDIDVELGRCQHRHHHQLFHGAPEAELTATAKKNEDGGQAQALLDALADGTLTVNDPQAASPSLPGTPQAPTQQRRRPMGRASGTAIGHGLERLSQDPPCS